MTIKLATPSKAIHDQFIGAYVSKATLKSLDRVAVVEQTSRSFILRKLLTEILKQYEAAHTVVPKRIVIVKRPAKV